eukprot:TRINITY_DN521_c3_g1_i1.p1 TRINITY_DN521_c3_g1~~TRINITY_DN521_c3_g1_i1.p1  ORF type:complete len:384 (-),score=162.38 TRINITY_DN521_c3_g1_i1:153-1304(-)
MSLERKDVHIVDNGLIEEEEEKRQEQGQRALTAALTKLNVLEKEVREFEAPPRSLFLDPTCCDIAWGPSVPIGHSAYSWLGESENNNLTNTTTMSSTSTSLSTPTLSTPPLALSSSSSSSVSSPSTSSTDSASAAPAKGKQGKKAETNNTDKQQQQQKGKKGGDNKKKGEESGNKKKEEKKAEPKKQPPVKKEVPKMTPEEEKVFLEKEAKLSPIQSFGRLDIRVGKIVEISEIAKSTSLFKEMIDLGEGTPRQICSGLRAFYKSEELLNARVLVVTNLMPAILCNTKSNGMVLCASDDKHTAVKILIPPTEAKIGERVSLEKMDISTITPISQLNLKEDPVWGSIASKMRTDTNGLACYASIPFVTATGHMLPNELKSSKIS